MQTALTVLVLAMVFSSSSHAADFAVKQRYSGVFEVRDFDQFITNDDTPMRRRTIDIKSVEAKLDIEINPKSKFELELEVEHGGAGTAMEYEQDEFGEFESEIEKGGEVELEEAYYLRRLTESTDLVIGLAPVYMGFSAIQRKPLMYSAAHAGHLEARMIPEDWTEPGVQVRQRWGDITVRAGIVAGLNSEFFRTYSWVGGGKQRQFETMNFDEPAMIASVEYGNVAHGHGMALAYYNGGSQKQRYKRNRLAKQADVQLFNAMMNWRLWRLALKAEAIYGELENADEVSKRNNNLPGMAGAGGFNNVGSRAMLQSVQLDYDVIDSTSLFLRWGYVNTFYGVTGNVFADPRYDVRQNGWGIAHRWDDICAVKLEWYREWTKLAGMPDTTTYALQFAFDTGSF
ncbi:MAG: hypothetical protein KF799_16295 [Bdellovibrionales bacterium]|nr:hypothetical protein [Bdellovibrionales bacterium]